MLDAVAAGAVPHHNFHVLAVYPWLGLLRTGIVDEPLHVLDRCRTTPAQRGVGRTATSRPRVLRPLVWNGRTLELGPMRVAGGALARRRRSRSSPSLDPDDWVSIHWDFVCDRLSPGAAARLERETHRTLAAVNTSSASAAALS